MRNKNSSFLVLLLLVGFGFCFSAHAQIIDKIVAIVNDDIITLVELNQQTQPYIDKIKASGYTDEKKERMIKAVNKELLNALIDNLLTEQEAKRHRISISDAEVDTALANIRKEKSFTPEEFKKALEYEGLDYSEYRENIRKQILHARIINVAVKSKVVITPDEIKAYYDANIQDYEKKKKYHLRHIVMNNMEMMKEVKERLDQKQSFVILAKQFSIAPNAKDGGDLGAFDISGFSKELKAVISKLKKGQYSDILATPQGLQIFYVEDIIQGDSKAFENARIEIQKILYQKQVEKKFDDWLKTLKENAHINIML